MVAIAAGEGTWTCVLVAGGAYRCPPLHEPTGPRFADNNATIDEHGVLRLEQEIEGTLPTAPLPWQRYPHVDGFVLPWKPNGKLRPGLRFVATDRGRCFHIGETVRSGISCLGRAGLRADACFPQRRNWRAGDLAACGALGDTDFLRWTITGR
jgi:hypothetical protein